jgi:predicted PurR-regulated permease PerM
MPRQSSAALSLILCTLVISNETTITTKIDFAAVINNILQVLPETTNVAIVIYIGITALEGQVITPTLMGHRLTINPFLVFLSIAFWTWMWGPVGAFLAVPILLCAMVAVRRL